MKNITTNEVEENNYQNEELLLLEAAEQASSKAIYSSLSKGLTITIIENHSIVEVSNEGKRIVGAKLKKDYDYSKLKKGMILEKKMKVPRLRIFAGPNGSGKSTLYNEFLERYDTGILVNADEIELKFQKHSHINLADFNLNLSSNDWTTFINSPISESLLQKSEIENISLILKFENNIILLDSGIVNSYLCALVSAFLREQLIKSKIDFSFESVMSHKSKLNEIQIAKENSFKTYLYFICIDHPEINISRVQNRFAKGGHAVSHDKIKSRYYKTLGNLNSAIEICDKSYLFDNSGDQLSLIAKVVNNKLELTVEPEELPEWFIEYVLKYYNI